MNLGWLWKAFTIISAILSIIMTNNEWSKTSERCSQLKGRWMEVYYEYENMWLVIDQKDENQLLDSFKNIKERERTVKKDELLIDKQKLIERCYQKVIKSKGL